jgi:GTPase Era involved in 16S rRNA processing
MDFGSRFSDTIKRSGGVEDLFRPNIGVSTLPVNSVVNSGVNFPSQKPKSSLKKISTLSSQTVHETTATIAAIGSALFFVLFFGAVKN